MLKQFGILSNRQMKRIKPIYSLLILLTLIPIILLFKAQIIAEIMADYVYFLFMVGLLYQYLQMLWKTKKIYSHK